MFLENLSFDALDPRRLGRFWEAALGAQVLTDEPDAYETRLAVDGGPTLDLCFQRVPDPPSQPPRVHLNLAGGPRQHQVVDRLLGLGARPLDIGRGDVPWAVLADPEGNPFCLMETRAEDAASGPIAAVPVDSADPEVDAAFWSWLTGWPPVAGRLPGALQHPSGRGPVLEFRPEPGPKPPVKNRLHLDLRLTGEDLDTIVAGIVERGGQELHPDWGDLPWRVFADPSGNEFCILPSRDGVRH